MRPTYFYLFSSFCLTRTCNIAHSKWTNSVAHAEQDIHILSNADKNRVRQHCFVQFQGQRRIKEKRGGARWLKMNIMWSVCSTVKFCFISQDSLNENRSLVSACKQNWKWFFKQVPSGKLDTAQMSHWITIKPEARSHQLRCLYFSKDMYEVCCLSGNFQCYEGNFQVC